MLILVKAVAEGEAGRHGHTAESKMVVSHDPAIDLDDTLMRTLRFSITD